MINLYLNFVVVFITGYMTELGVELSHGPYETTRRSSSRTLIIVSPQQEADLFLRNDCAASSRGRVGTASDGHLILPPFHQN